MDPKQEMDKFNKRWNIPKDSYEKEFAKFKIRILNSFKGIDRLVGEQNVSEFCKILGIKEKSNCGTLCGMPDVYGERWLENIYPELEGENNEKRFYGILQKIFLLPLQGVIRTKIFNSLKEALKYSEINLVVEIVEDQVVFYPKGEEVLDEKLVNEVLSFLPDNPQLHFVEALKFYQKGTPAKFIKSLESLRRCLEEFLRFKLQNKIGLQKNLLEVGKKMKEIKIDSQVRNIVTQIIGYLDKYFNENSKHNDGKIDESGNEFLIYQSGLLMRYLNKIL